ncbi:putative metaxin, glutathione S-transferase domain-containing protein [Rosa chinensis]|uniref:Putative metaxin, glutathione S-transferase domain-containing protein n=1 Tax=Rosa chinensis TaxID=74649 RepID=A0A2P6P597_ROSCH|nr:putative metaxin, glutathione S-transferase domain-containing protein [Rosa chinensis]
MKDYSLLVRKPCFGLPTACPSCLPVYFFLKFADVPFKLDYNLTYPDSGLLMQSGMTSGWELMVPRSAQSIYCSDLPWPIGKILFLKQVYNVKQQLGITKDNAEEIEEQIYKKASIAFGALSSRLVDQMFLYEKRPSSLDDVFLSQALITLQALPETSILRSKLLEYENLVGYASRIMELFDAGTSSSVPGFHAYPSSSALRRDPSNLRSKPKPKTKREKTKEEVLKRRARYVFIALLVSIVLFVTHGSIRWV